MRYFSLGLASGSAFCNRVQERKRLKLNIENNIHTAVVASRRYGKTSLIRKVIHDGKYDSILIDFLVASSLSSAMQILVDSLSDFLVKKAPSIKKIKPLLSKFFRFFEPTVSVGLDDELSVELSLKKNNII